MSKLFTPLQMGDILLPNRIVMSALTRCRASEGRVPNNLMRQYYTQRASAGIILTEAIAISEQAVGYRDTPGIWNNTQVEAWKKITQSVHTAGGRIIAQLWHVGRISHPSYLQGRLPSSSSAITPLGHVRLADGQRVEYTAPKALDIAEINEVIEHYRIAAKNAKEAGFDGVEIHGANSYLPDQFLRDSTNVRNDEYGGEVANRARFLLQVTDAAISEVGAGRVGVHLSPQNVESVGAVDSNPEAVFSFVASEMHKRKVAFIFVRESLQSERRIMPLMRKNFGGVVIANESYSVEDANMVLDNNEADAVAWGRWFIANPDLPERLLTNSVLNDLVPSTVYALGPTGYTDYPALR